MVAPRTLNFVFPAPVKPSADLKSTAAGRAVGSVALIDVAPTGRVYFATEKAEALLAKYCHNTEQLPPTLVRCVSEHRLNGVATPLPWTLEADCKHLVIKMTGRAEGHVQLLLEERGDILTAGCLQEALSLTPREAEVLLWISKGKTSPEIGSILGCKSATVNKHTQSIFSKLGVETRTAAAAMAIELIR